MHYNIYLMNCIRYMSKNDIDTIVFRTSRPNLPLTLTLLYETIPLFTKPLYTCNVNYCLGWKNRHDCFLTCFNHEKDGNEIITNSIYSDSIWVYAPVRGTRGLAPLTETILPYFSKIQTIRDCYLAHKEYHLGTDPKHRYSGMSSEFIDEVLYVADKEVFPYCLPRIEQRIKTVQNQLDMKPNNRELGDMMLHWRQLHFAFTDGTIDEYKMLLEQRKQANCVYLAKVLKLQVL